MKRFFGFPILLHWLLKKYLVLSNVAKNCGWKINVCTTSFLFVGWASLEYQKTITGEWIMLYLMSQTLTDC
jgi:hypothetical protein